MATNCTTYSRKLSPRGKVVHHGNSGGELGQGRASIEKNHPLAFVDRPRVTFLTMKNLLQIDRAREAGRGLSDTKLQHRLLSGGDIGQKKLQGGVPLKAGAYYCIREERKRRKKESETITIINSGDVGQMQIHIPLFAMHISRTIAVALSALIVAVTAAPSQGRASVYSQCSVPGAFALTFDDGPYQYSWYLASYLKEKGIPATFFVNGKNWV